MNRFLARACVAAVAGVALSMVAVTGASASGGGGGVLARRGALGAAGMVAGPGGAWRPAGQAPAIGRAGAAVANSRTFAGYWKSRVPAGPASVTASFTVPALSCAPPDLGIAAMAGEGVNSTGVLTAAGVAIRCESGKALYFPALVINGAGTSYRSSPFAAGDVIDLSAGVTTSATTVQVTDVTKNVTKTLTGAGASPITALIGDDGWASTKGVLLGVPDFGKLTFTSCQIDGTALQTWHPQQFQRVNAKGIVQIATGPFSPAPAAFATYYRHQ